MEDKTDSELVLFICDNIRAVAVLSSRGHMGGAYQDKVDAGYDEAMRRKKPHLYDRAYKMACRSFGYS